MTVRSRIRPLVAGLAVGATTLVGGCTGPAVAPKPASLVSVRLANFRIDIPKTVKAGLVEFDLLGVGPTMHEFNVVRTNRAANDLPLAADGTVDDQQPHPDFDHLAEREGVDMGGHATLTVRLAPGHYVVYCNMDGHYQAGMSAGFDVR